MINNSNTEAKEMTSAWQPIENAPKDGTEILLRGKVRHIHGNERPVPYVTDVYHGWFQEQEQTWARWPHGFEPTHFMHIPAL